MSNKWVPKQKKSKNFHRPNAPYDALNILSDLARMLRPQYECRLCGTELRYDQRQFNNWVIHKPNCPWGRTEVLLGLRPPIKEYYPDGPHRNNHNLNRP